MPATIKHQTDTISIAYSDNHYYIRVMVMNKNLPNHTPIDEAVGKFAENFNTNNPKYDIKNADTLISMVRDHGLVLHDNELVGAAVEIIPDIGKITKDNQTAMIKRNFRYGSEGKYQNNKFVYTEQKRGGQLQLH